jgi:hypothetical protein
MFQLKTKIWVDALIRRAELGFASIYVIRRGDEDAGVVLVKVVDAARQARLYVPERDQNGKRVWRLHGAGTPGEAEIDAYCAKRTRSDGDLWLIEIEDRAGTHYLEEAIIES